VKLADFVVDLDGQPSSLLHGSMVEQPRRLEKRGNLIGGVEIGTRIGVGSVEAVRTARQLGDQRRKASLESPDRLSLEWLR
jgi:hypothetical protein